ncbi:MAG: divergent polysaccharide deacetylase family protein [Pseudomonadota bacterium]
MIRGLLIALALSAFTSANAATPPPKVAIIIDDIGYRYQQDRQALQLPTEIAFAIIPGSDHGRALGEAAVQQGREVLVHLPMEPVGVANARLGPVAIDHTDDELAVRRTLRAAMEELPFATGLNNHMGSRLTQERRPMLWLMESILCRRDLYFVDSYTTRHSVALATADALSIPAVRRDVFLDHVQTPAAIEVQVRRLVHLARQQGQALAIAHPHAPTLDALRALPRLLQAQGIELVAPSALVGDPSSRGMVAEAD